MKYWQSVNLIWSCFAFGCFPPAAALFPVFGGTLFFWNGFSFFAVNGFVPTGIGGIPGNGGGGIAEFGMILIGGAGNMGRPTGILVGGVPARFGFCWFKISCGVGGGGTLVRFGFIKAAIILAGMMLSAVIYR